MRCPPWAQRTSAIRIRGGSGVVFNNKVYLDRQAGYNWLVYHQNLRSDDTSRRTFPPWESSTHQFPNCDGTAPWDGNTGDPSGKGYRCLDQPGSGTSVDFKDTDVPPNIPAQNTLEPIYVWGNLANDIPENCGNQSWSCGSDGVVVAGRDIIYSTPRPGYVPFTYPHPLVGGSQASPLPPLTGAPLSTSIAPTLSPIAPTPSSEATATPAPTVLSAGVSTTPPTPKSTGGQPAAATPLSIMTPVTSAAATSPSTTDVRPTAAIFPAASVTSPQGVGAQPNPATGPQRDWRVSPTPTTTPPATTDARTTEPIRPESPPLRVAAIPPSATATLPTEITPGPPAAAGPAPQIVVGSPGPRRNRALPVTVTSEIQLAQVKVFIDDKLVLTLATTAMKLTFSQSLPNRKAVMVRVEATDAGGHRATQRVAIPPANDVHSVAGDRGRSYPPRGITTR